MLVSNFELLVKRIAPLGNSQPVNAPFRRVVQGYFLTLTNLDPARATSFFLTLTIPRAGGPNNPTDNEIVPGTPSVANVVCLTDSGTTNNQNRAIILSVSNVNHKKFITSSFPVRPLETVLVAILPNIGANTTLITKSALEIRGFVEISQTSIQGPSRPPIDVLITPETRGTFLDNDYPDLTLTKELDFDQISYGLPTFSGGSKNTVELAPGLPFDPLPGSGLRTARFAVMPDNNEQLIKEAIAELQEELRLYGSSEE